MGGDAQFFVGLEYKPNPASESEMKQSLFYVVQPGYLSAMEIPLHRGRFLTKQDNEHAPPVIVVDEDFAREYFPNEDPIGKRIHVSIINTQPEIIGIVGHVKHWGLDTDGDAKHSILAQVYMPLMQLPDQLWSGPPYSQVVARIKGPTAGAFPAIRETIEKMNGENVLFDAKSLEEVVGDSMAARRFTMVLLAVFAGLALLLSSIGIYGVISYVVSQRTNEIGIRIALGAQQRDVLRLMLGEGMKMALLGVFIGIAVAFGLTHLMVNILFGVSATDPLTFLGVATLLVLVALTACWIPARRATRVDPLVALRYE